MDRWLEKIRSLFARATPDEAGSVPEESSATRGRLDAFQRDLGVTFLDLGLLEQALTHRSFLGCVGGDPALSNERMEFLGDAVLELIVIEYLYSAHPEDREGALTKRKGLLVSRKVLASSAEWMKLGDYVLLSEAERESGGSARSSILADTFEAVVGAIYLDQGLEPARRFVGQRLLVHADRIFQDLSRANFKSQLQEHVQATFKTHPRYRVVTEIGPDHRKLFTVEVTVRNQLLGRGQGYNKKEAQQSAARYAILKLERDAARSGNSLPNLSSGIDAADFSLDGDSAEVQPSAIEDLDGAEDGSAPAPTPTERGEDVSFVASLRRTAAAATPAAAPVEESTPTLEG